MSSEEEFSKNSAKFANDLYQVIAATKSGESIILSPFSIQTCLGLAFVGAANKTAQELQNGLYLTSSNPEIVGEQFKNVLDLYSKSPLLKIANKIYVNQSIQLKSNYLNIVTKKFHSEAENVDFSNSVVAAKTINDWVELKTNNKIKNLISSDSVDDSTLSVLVNAIHFKGQWEHEFKKDKTKKEDFWLTETQSVKIDMMNGKIKCRHGIYGDLNAAGIILPYKNSDLSMFILLPDQRNGLKDLEVKLKNVNLIDLMSETYETDVIVKLPKFTVESSVELNQPLKELGMKAMFSTTEADFSNMCDKPAYVSKVIHKAFIEVNEEGTEAAAATAAIVMMRCSFIPPEQPKEFYADRSFLYVITDRSNWNNLFVGRFIGQ